MVKIKGKVGNVLVGCVIAGTVFYAGWDLYKRISFKYKKPEIIEQVYKAAPDSNTMSVRIAVKQDPFWDYPERLTYQSDRETIYMKQESGEWKEYKGIWMDKGMLSQLDVEKTRVVSEEQIPGQPKNALEIIIDLDSNEEYAEASFKINKSSEATKEEIEQWVTKMKPLLLKNYKEK